MKAGGSSYCDALCGSDDFNVLSNVDCCVFVNSCCVVMLKVEEQDPDLAFRDVAKFGILQIAGMILQTKVNYELQVLDTETAADHTLLSSSVL